MAKNKTIKKLVTLNLKFNQIKYINLTQCAF